MSMQRCIDIDATLSDCRMTAWLAFCLCSSDFFGLQTSKRKENEPAKGNYGRNANFESSTVKP